MSDNTNQPTFIPFRQVPEWNDDEQFIITGKQLTAIQNLFKAYSPFVQALEPIFTDNLDNGKIVIRYEDLEGKPIPKEDIDSMLESYAQAMAAAMNE